MRSLCLTGATLGLACLLALGCAADGDAPAWDPPSPAPSADGLSFASQTWIAPDGADATPPDTTGFTLLAFFAPT